MLTPDLLFDYQKKAVNFQCTHPHTAMVDHYDGAK